LLYRFEAEQADKDPKVSPDVTGSQMADLARRDAHPD
jgi:hypothetical protein